MAMSFPAGANQPILTTSHRGPFRVAIELWRAGGSFRGFLEFALVGAVVLAFLSGKGRPSFSTASKEQSETAEPKQATDAPAGVPGFAAPALAPRLNDVSFGPSYLQHADPTIASALARAWDAYRQRRYDEMLAITAPLNQDDKTVLLVRGIALIAMRGGDNFQDGLRSLKKASDFGEPRAMALLGVLRVTGVPGLTRDLEAGKRLLEQSSAAGDWAAPKVIGDGFLNGWMGAVDGAQAARYYRLAVERGNPKAMTSLANLYITGRGVEKDYVKAEKLLLKAAAANNEEAQAMLGTWLIIKYGSGATDDPAEALEWLEKAAEKGEPHAMYQLGMFYLEYGRKSGRADLNKGADLMRQCVDKSMFGDCIFAYATALDLGLGTTRDAVKSYALYSLVASQGNNPKAKARMEELRKSMSSSDVDVAGVYASKLVSGRRANATSH